MTILEILSKLVGPAAPLRAFLERVAAELPDLAPTAIDWIARLDAAVPAQNLAELGAAIPMELLNISQGKIEPKDHPSDAA